MALTFENVAAQLRGSRATGISEFLEKPITRNISVLLTDYGLERNTTGIAFVAMAHALSAIDPTVLYNGLPNRWQFTYQQLPAAGGEIAPAALNVNLDADAINGAIRMPNDVKAWLLTLVNSLGSATAWLIDLAACHQVSALKARSIASYFASFNNTVVSGIAILPLVSYLASRINSLVDSDIIRPRLTANRFMRYHTSFAATPGLILQMVEALGNYADALIDPAALAVVREANTNYWSEEHNQLIPVKLIAMACVWRDVNGREIPDWRQGAKAIDTVSVTVQNGWKALFKRINSIAMVDLNAITTDAGLIATITNALKIASPNVQAANVDNDNGDRDEDPVDPLA